MTKQTYVEDAIQAAFISWLKIQIATGKTKHLKSLKFNGVPNMRMSSKIQRIVAARRGYRAGLPDTQFWWVNMDGTKDYSFIEFKAPKLRDASGYVINDGGTLNPAQKEFRDECLAAGENWGEARSVEEAAELLKLWGVIR
jgi:hypothetical protein